MPGDLGPRFGAAESEEDVNASLANDRSGFVGVLWRGECGSPRELGHRFRYSAVGANARPPPPGPLPHPHLGSRPARAQNAPAIEELNLYFAEQISDEGASVVKNWKHLKRLNLRGTKITDSTLEFLAGVPTLEWLDVGWAQTTDTGFEHLAALTNLRSLTMGGNKLTDTALQFLRQMPQLEYLDISGQQRTDSGLWSLLLTETGMQSIASVTDLRELRIGGTAVTTRALEPLRELRKLERLDLQGCKRLKDDAAGVLASFKQLRVLDLTDSSLSKQAVEQIRAALPQAEVLY